MKEEQVTLVVIELPHEDTRDVGGSEEALGKMNDAGGSEEVVGTGREISLVISTYSKVWVSNERGGYAWRKSIRRRCTRRKFARMKCVNYLQKYGLLSFASLTAA